MEPNVPPGTKLRILIVAGSLTVRMDLGHTFESAEFETVLCDTLSAARAEIACRPPSLVILDVFLPDGDGIELLRDIRSSPARVPVMLLSTEAEAGARARERDTAADEYVGKPYDSSYVLARARDLIGASTSPPQPDAPGLLLIDDSASSREQFASILRGAGYHVVTAENGGDGLRIAFEMCPTAIIVDRVLPGGIDGDTVIRRLKQDVRMRNIPCILLTAAAGEGEEFRMLDAGADAYFNKDVGVDVFLARVAALIRSAGPPASVAVPLPHLGGPRRVLAVDDSLTYLTEVSAEMRQEGYDVVQALSGIDALKLLELQPVDCILLDVRMPGLSGLETCRAIKQRPAVRGIPLLMLTAAESPEAVIEGINAGADDYICKSDDFTVLKARVRAQLRRKRFEEEYRQIGEELLRKEVEAAEARAQGAIAQARAALVDELENKNRELEAFTSAVAHDLRSPVRTIRGFSQAILDDFAAQLPGGAREHLQRIQSAALRMSRLIDALLELSRTTTVDLRRQTVDLSELAAAVAAELAEHGSTPVEFSLQRDLAAHADPTLMRVVFQNLLGNAWKFTGKSAQPRVEVGAFETEGRTVYFVRDNGVGFASSSARKLFQPFERLHAASEFPGAGIGLATVRRIIERHQGEIWAESEAMHGAAFYFTIGASASSGAGDRLARHNFAVDSVSLCLPQRLSVAHQQAEHA